MGPDDPMRYGIENVVMAGAKIGAALLLMLSIAQGLVNWLL